MVYFREPRIKVKLVQNRPFYIIEDDNMMKECLEAALKTNTYDWQDLGDGLSVRVEDDDYLVSQPGDEADNDVRKLLAKKFGGSERDYSRRSDWSSADGETDVTARWVRC